jgi:AmmeMemoRadiSam system protein B
VRTVLRRAAVAGTWYPGRPDELGRQVDDVLARARAQVTIRPGVVGLIAPHAGLVYSGPTAAFAYAALGGTALDAAVLVGPSHYVAFDGVSIWPAGAFDTPFGPVPVAGDLARALLAFADLIRILPAAHTREHSLEMQVPFLARACPGLPIVPLVMGSQDRPTIEGLAEALAEACAGLRVVLVASSDLSHFFDADTAGRLDARVADLVAASDADGLLAELERYPDHERGRFVMCGGGPVVAVMRAARRLGARTTRVLARSHSGEVSGDYDRVVGYLAAACSTA